MEVYPHARLMRDQLGAFKEKVLCDTSEYAAHRGAESGILRRRLERVILVVVDMSSRREAARLSSDAHVEFVEPRSDVFVQFELFHDSVVVDDASLTDEQ